MPILPVLAMPLVVVAPGTASMVLNEFAELSVARPVVLRGYQCDLPVLSNPLVVWSRRMGGCASNCEGRRYMVLPLPEYVTLYIATAHGPESSHRSRLEQDALVLLT